MNVLVKQPYIFRLGTAQNFKLAVPQLLSQDQVIDITNRTELEQAITVLDIRPKAILIPDQSDSLALSHILKHWSDTLLLIEQAGQEPAGWFDINTQQLHAPMVAVQQNNAMPVMAAPLTNVPKEPLPLAAGSSIAPSSKPINPVQQKDTVAEASFTNRNPDNSILATEVIAHDSSESLARSFLDSKQLLKDIFRFSSYGPEYDDHVMRLLCQAEEYKSHYPDLKRAAQKRKQGQRAYQLIEEAKAILRKLGDGPQFESWLQTRLSEEQSETIKRFLQHKVKKEKEYLASKRMPARHKPQSCLVQAPVIDATHPHPNNLRHLEPHHYWEIMIDETGSEFQQVTDHNAGDSKVGRIVALAVPKGKTTLPALGKHFHATDMTKDSNTLDHLINTVLSHPVGLLGLSLKDQLSYHSTNWFSEVYNLLRLTLRLLPLSPVTSATVSNKVYVYIENRGRYDAATSLDILPDMLLSELKSLDEARFSQLHLNIQIVPKDGHPYLGYVDALAHTWGGSSAKQRLKQAKFVGHCFLNPAQESIERIYAALENKKLLTPAQWYQVLEHLAGEPPHSLLHQALQQLGQQCQKDEQLWKDYLQEVTYRLDRKQYSAASLDRILLWLKDYQPKQQKFTPQLELRWLTAKLAADNHMGRVNRSDSQQLLVLGESLQAEIAPEVCQAYLRIAVAETNNFAFESSKLILDKAIVQAVEAVGRLNHAKINSSLGQFYSFNRDYTQADSYFARALDEFRQYSEPKDREANIQQTTIYRLFNAIDGQLLDATALRAELEQHYQRPIDAGLLQRLVVTNDKKDSYNHHLLLRSFVAFPQTFKAEIQAYLALAGQWQHEQNHPWSLIEFWRGWLFLQQDNQALHRAQQQFGFAIAQQDNDSITLRWIVLVLATVAKKFDTDLDEYPLIEQYQHLQQCLHYAPHAAYKALQKEQSKAPEVLYPHIAACLPFNFK